MSRQNLDISDIMRLLPHRYPFLLIDSMEQADGDDFGVGIKNVTINEPFFVGHFPSKPIMPGVLIIEAMAQTCGALVIHNMPNASEDCLVYFMSIDNVKFRKPVTPGDRIYLEVTKEKNRRNVWKYNCVAKVDGQKVAEAAITAMIADSDDTPS